MRKGYELIGLRVIGVQDVTDLGKVLDLIFDQKADQCLGLVMQEGGLMSEAQVVAWSEIRTVGPDAIMVNSSASKVGLSSAPELQDAMTRKSSLSGDRIVTTGGNVIGSLGDVYLDEQTGRVEGYEVSGGVVSDAVSGKNYLPADAIPEVGHDTILVAPHVESMIQQQNDSSAGGLKAVAQSAGEKVSSAYDTVKDKATETYANVASASIDKQKEFVVGKVAGQDVFLPTASTATVPSTVTTSATPALPAASGTVALNEADLLDRDLDVETTYEPREGTMGTFPTSTHAPDIAPTSYASGVSDVSAPGLNFNEVEPATILDPMGQKAAPSEITGYNSVELSGSSHPTFDPSTVSASGLQFDEVEPATILDPMGEHAAAGSSTLAVPSESTTAPDHGPLLVAQGDTITQQHADTAESAGILHQLLLAVGSGAVAGATDSAQNTASGVANSGQVQSGLNTAGEQASQLLSSARDKGSQLVSAAQDRKSQLDADNERKRINHALGRPVTRVILAKDDTVILNVGDLITNKAVRLSRESNALETLLSSVYDEEPQITPAMARATQPGEAAIPSQAPLMQPPMTAIAPPEESDPSQTQPPQSGQPQS